MICNNCKHENNDGSQFCKYCGGILEPQAIEKPVNNKPVDQTTRNSQNGAVNNAQSGQRYPARNASMPGAPQQFRPVVPPEKKGNGKMIAIIVSAVAVGIIAAVVIVFVVLNNMNPKTTSDDLFGLFNGSSSGSSDTAYETLNSSYYGEQPTSAASDSSSSASQQPSTLSAQVDYDKKTEPEAATYFKSASASSVLPDQAGHNYSASNVLKDDGTCWCENSSGYGEGEWIKLELPAKQKLSGLRLINGYAGTETQYNNNSKPSEIRLDFSDGSSTTVELNVFGASQRKSVQTISFNTPVETEYVKITIVSVSKAEMKDTCLSFVEPY